MSELSDTQLVKEIIECSLQLLEELSKDEFLLLLQRVLSVTLSLTMQNLTLDQIFTLLSEALTSVSCLQNTDAKPV